MVGFLNNVNDEVLEILEFILIKVLQKFCIVFMKELL